MNTTAHEGKYATNSLVALLQAVQSSGWGVSQSIAVVCRLVPENRLSRVSGIKLRGEIRGEKT